MNKNNYISHGLQLPAELIKLIEDGNWTVPNDKTGIINLLTSSTLWGNRFDDLTIEVENITLYDFELMKSESFSARNWRSETSEYDIGFMFSGKKDGQVIPGDIDFRKAIIIADLGHGSDTPIVLDYRNKSTYCSDIIVGRKCNAR